MRYFSLLILADVLTISACKSSNKSTANAGGMTTFGEDFKVAKVLTYDQLLSQLKPGKEMEVQVEGLVDGVCQAKGCWMNIVSDKNPNADKMFVKFHNYGFFMPKDLSGKKVIMKGKAYVEETSVDELRHYAEDEGKSKEDIEKINQPKKELKFMATGVKIKG
ncbi:MAG: DUF4920 domain-containing protein [Saprospiraceae bacterium]|nr:DUF4920 domain-containing protein [Saprospiraceae bacterium]